MNDQASFLYHSISHYLKASFNADVMGSSQHYGRVDIEFHVEGVGDMWVKIPVKSSWQEATKLCGEAFQAGLKKRFAA